MDIIASMLAYLGCVTGILGALAISAFVVFSPPHQPATPAHTLAMTAKPSVAKATLMTAAAAKPAPGIMQADSIVQADDHAASLGPKLAPVPQTTVGRTASAAGVRKKTQLAAAALRRQAQEQRAKRWAYQQDADFGTRFLGYTD
jgi:hypothetical protein